MQDQENHFSRQQEDTTLYITSTNHAGITSDTPSLQTP